MDKKKKLLLIFLVIVFLLLPLFSKKLLAAPANNPVFATIQWVQGEIQHLLSIFNQHETRNQTDFEFINRRAEKLENQIIGAMPDQNAPQLGLINFSGTADEYHFWFTPNTNVLEYIAGHTYHIIYKAEVENPDDWCGQAPVVDRPPYNLFGNTRELVYFRIIDVTTGETPCF